MLFIQFMECLSDFNTEGVNISKFRQDEFSRILKIPGRGLVVDWTAEIAHKDDELTEELIASKVMNCKDNVILEPESVHVGDVSIFSKQKFLLY